jgi:hypothetical protein
MRLGSSIKSIVGTREEPLVTNPERPAGPGVKTMLPPVPPMRPAAVLITLGTICPNELEGSATNNTDASVGVLRL